MTKAEIVSTFEAALRSIGYDKARIRRHYDFCDLTSSTAEVRRIPLAAFDGYPQSYRNARVGIIFADGIGGGPPTNYRALGAPVLMTVQNGTVQPWAAGLETVKLAGQPFSLRDTERAFQDNRDSWSPEALGRVKTTADVSGSSQPELFDTGLGNALQQRFQIRLKELLEHSFKEIEAAYRGVHGRSPKVSPLFAFLFRFVTAKIFMDRADAKGWDGLSDPLEILKAAEKQTGLLEKPESDFRRKPILDAAWASVSRNLHFQNLSVPDLAFVAESAFITDRTRAELGVHSTPEGLADYIVSHLPWDQVPVDERVVWEPFCGHGIFLAKAMERLGRDINPSLTPKDRHEYFRHRLIGVETDPLSLEICRLVLTLSDYPNDNSWELYHADVFEWPEWRSTLESAAAVLANPPYEAFDEKHRQRIDATKTKPPAELLHRILQKPPRLLGLVLPQSFLSDPIYRDANRQMARSYDSIQIVELPRIFRYANNETVAVMASGRRTEGRTVQVNYAEVSKDGVARFMEDWHVSSMRSAEVPVPPATGGSRFTLRLLPADSVFAVIKTPLKLSDVVTDIHKGINWIARRDGKSQTEPRKDVAADKKKNGYFRGAEKMNGNLTQFQLRSLRYLSLLDEDQDPTTRANKRPWERRKSVCNAARFQPLSPWRLAAFADAEGLAFTKQYFAIWPKEGVSEFAIAAIVASPIANAFSYERDLDRDNHIETLHLLPLPDLKHLHPGGELHRRAAELQRLLTVPEILAQPPAPEAVIEALLRLDAAVLDAYGLSAAMQRQLLKMFDGWPRPLTPPYNNAFTRYFPDHFEQEITLSDYLAITSDWDATNKRRHNLIEKKRDKTITSEEKVTLEMLQRLAGLKSELLSSPSLKELAQIEADLRRRGLWRGA